METSDKQFVMTFLGVLAVLIALAIGIWAVARHVGGKDTPHLSRAQYARIEARVRPVAEVRLASAAEVEPAAAAPQADSEAEAGPIDGQAVYQASCAACHETGVAGAPVRGRAADWAERLARGEDALFSSVLNGKNAMPPRGGAPAASDAELRAALDHLLAPLR